METQKFQILNFKFQILLIWGLGGLLLLSGCKTEVPSSAVATDTYIHTYIAPGDQTSWFIKPTDDKGCLFIGTEDNISNLLILKINEKGGLESKDTIKGLEMIAPIFTNLSDGGILICSGYDNGNLCKLDKNGKIVFASDFGGTKKANSYPVVMNDGTYAIASAFSRGPGVYSNINFIKPDGKNSGQIQISDASFGLKFKTIYTSLHRCDSAGTYYFNGWCFPNWNNSFNSKYKLFIAKQKYKGSTLIYNKTLVLDSLNKNNASSGIYQVTTKDKHLMLAESQIDINNVNKGHIIKVDNDLNIVWQKDLRVSTDGTYCNGISECPDGNYLIIGQCAISGKSVGQPFACKMDKNGNIMWQKIYSTALSSYFSWGEQAADGTCFFAGNTSGFGQGIGLSDLFIMKTDKDGNLK
mgnify:CR=1 FL=1